MGLSKNIPVFLDEYSGWNKAQAEYINVLVKTIRHKFESKAKQNKESKPVVSHLVYKKYGRILDLKDYKYRNYFTLSFILNPTGFVENGVYNLFDTKENIQYINMQGSNSSTVLAKSLTALGSIKIIDKGTYTTVAFVKNDEEWPKDANNLPVQYSVSMNGRLSN